MILFAYEIYNFMSIAIFIYKDAFIIFLVYKNRLKNNVHFFILFYK